MKQAFRYQPVPWSVPWQRALTLLVAAGLVTLAIPAGPLFAADAYFDIAVSELKFTQGSLPAEEGSTGVNWRTWDFYKPRAVLDEGEVFISGSYSYWNWPREFLQQGRLHIRAPAGKAVVGRLLVPRLAAPGEPTKPGLEVLEFQIPAGKAVKTARGAFLVAKEDYLANLVSRRVPGTAWFRHELRQLRQERSKTPLEHTLDRQSPQRWDGGSGELSDTFELFTGGRALSENLQLDRMLSPRAGGEETVDISTIEGITVKEIDWSPKLVGKNPKPDPLAALIPADQHALFFPKFSDMTRLTDEADTIGTPVLAILEPRSEDAGTKRRYQDQLALSMSGLSRLLGPSIVASVAFTGSDPFLRVGSDVAVLFEAKKMGLLKQHITGKQEAALAATPGAKSVSGEAGGLAYSGVCSKTRQICSYLAESGTVLMVTNSLAQLEHIGKAAGGQEPAMASLPEYLFFRDRYPLGDKSETAFLILPDAAIRRWCSPKWRVADSRRTRMAAILSEMQATHLESIVRGEKIELKSGGDLPDVGKVEMSPGGLLAPGYGTLDFMTPIIEMPLDKVTKAEADAYGWFRDRYQRNWRDYFDPIAIRFFVDENTLELDLSVVPLIAGTEYRELLDLSLGATMDEWAGDPHDGALFRYGMSININSRLIKQGAGFAVSMAPGFSANALSWLGQYIVIYGDKDPFWQQLITAPKMERFAEANIHRLPVALYVAVSSPLKVTAFLASVRAFIEQTAPGMTVWEHRKYKKLSYVKVSPSASALSDDDVPEQLALYYAVSGKHLIFTLNEEMLKRALKRESARSKSKKKKKKVDAQGAPWLGTNVGFQADAETLELLEIGAREEYIPELQQRAFAAIPILNEWKRLFPERNPVEVHQQAWGTKLLCPGGGEYVWNEKWRTMESTVYGHPGDPKEGPGLLRPPLLDLNSGNFGLTFEDDGLRARARLERNKKKRSVSNLLIGAACGSHPNYVCAAVPFAIWFAGRAWRLLDDAFIP